MSFVTVLCSATHASRVREVVGAQGYHVLEGPVDQGGVAAQVEARLSAHPDLVMIASRDIGAVLQLDRSAVRYWLLAVGDIPGAWLRLLPRTPHRLLESADGEDGMRLAQLLDDWRERSLPRIDLFHFSFRVGLPREADWVIDTRCLDSPHWVEDLRDRAIEDPGVRAYVTSQPAAQALLDHFTSMMTALIPEYVRQRRTVLRIAVGCTGGRHRSQVITDELVRRINATGVAQARRVGGPDALAPAAADMRLLGTPAPFGRDGRSTNGHRKAERATVIER
jgi:hypothetical protein